MKTPESYEKDKIKKSLKQIGAWFFLPYMAGFGKSGVSDIVACVSGRFIVIEVKREGKEPTPLQWERMREVEKAGGVAFWGIAEKVIYEIEHWRVTNGLKI